MVAFKERQFPRVALWHRVYLIKMIMIISELLVDVEEIHPCIQTFESIHSKL
jgi:hypothetical protein